MRITSCLMSTATYKKLLRVINHHQKNKLLDLLNSFKLSLDKFQKKKPNIFQLANQLRTVVAQFEDKHRIHTSHFKSKTTVSHVQGTLISLDSDRGDKQSIPSYQFFVTENINESIVSSEDGGRSYDGNEKSDGVERGNYIEFKIPKSWIDESQRRNQDRNQKKQKTIISNKEVAQGSRTLKFNLMLIKCKLKLKKLLLRARNNLKSAEYYHIYLKVTISYQKLTDGSYIRSLAVQDIVHQGFNKRDEKNFNPKKNLSKMYTLKQVPRSDPKNRRHTYNFLSHL